jgi:hypothetical protein
MHRSRGLHLLPVTLALACIPALAQEDGRTLVAIPAAAKTTLRNEMLTNLRVVNEVMQLVSTGKVKEAGTLAEEELGLTAMGRNARLPFDARPGAHMPPAMHAIGIDGHKAASRFARAAATGDREAALAALPEVTTSCVVCHHTYRIR